MNQFSQEEIEGQLSDAVPHGLRAAIAQQCRIYSSIVYAWFNANDERKSPQFTTLDMQAAMDHLSPADGEEHWQRMCAIREANRPHLPSDDLSVEHELGSLSKEITDVIIAKCEGKPIRDQLQEIHEAERQITRYKNAVLQGSQDVSKAGVVH